MLLRGGAGSFLEALALKIWFLDVLVTCLMLSATVWVSDPVDCLDPLKVIRDCSGIADIAASCKLQNANYKYKFS